MAHVLVLSNYNPSQSHVQCDFQMTATHSSHPSPHDPPPNKGATVYVICLAGNKNVKTRNFLMYVILLLIFLGGGGGDSHTYVFRPWL